MFSSTTLYHKKDYKPTFFGGLVVLFFGLFFYSPVKKEAPPSAVTPKGEPPAAFDYEKIDWHIIQVFEGDEGRDLVYGHIPIRSVRRFAKAQGIDDYTASDFHSAFKRSKTPFPRDWEKLFVRYSRADSKKQDEFVSRLLNGEYIEKWTE